MSVYAIKFAEVLVDVCKKDIVAFAKLSFSFEELAMLGVTVVGLLQWGLKKHHLPLLTHYCKLSLAEWKQLGLRELYLMQDLEVRKNRYDYLSSRFFFPLKKTGGRDVPQCARAHRQGHRERQAAQGGPRTRLDPDGGPQTTVPPSISWL